MSDLTLGLPEDEASRRVFERYQITNPLSRPGVPAPAGGGSDLASQRVVARFRAAQDRQLARNITAALGTNPELVAEAQKLGLAINVNPLQVEQDIEGYRQVYSRVRYDQWQRAASPILRRQMMDPAFARLAFDDLAELETIEAIGGGFGWGGEKILLGKLEAKIREGTATAEDLAQAELMRKSLEERGRVDLGFWGGSAEIVGQLYELGPGAAIAAIVGATLGAAVGGVITLSTGGTGAPAIPLGAKFGFQAGAAGSFVVQSALVEGGHHYRQLREEGIDHETAYWVSHAHGAVAGVLELGGLIPAGRIAGQAVGSVRRRLLARGSQEAAQRLSRPSTWRGGRDWALGVIQGVGGEVLTEGLQEITNEMFSEAARAHEGRPSNLSTPEGRARFVDRIGDVMAQTAKGMLLLALPGPTVRFLANQHRIAEINHDAAMFERLAQAQQNSKVHGRSPGQAAAFGNAVVGGTSPRRAEVYISGQKFAQSMAETNTSRETLEATLPGVTQKLDTALESGGDVVISNGEYQGFVIGTKLDGALRQHVRFTQDGYSIAELPAVQAVQEILQKAAVKQVQDSLTFEQEGARLAELFRKQVKDSGRRISGRVARDTAAVYRAFVETQARRLGITPFELVERIGKVTVERGERAAQESLKQPGLFGDLTSDFDPDAEGGSPLVSGLSDAELQAERERIETILEEGTPTKAGAPGTGPSILHQDKKYRVGVLRSKLNDTVREIDFREGRLRDPLARAEFIPATGTIKLFDQADLTSILHELAHGFLHWYGRLAAISDGPTQVRADMEAFLSWAGFEGTVEDWNAASLEQQDPYHEKFAETFEAYSFSGIAPSLPLQRVFARFRKFIVQLWRSLRGDVEVSEDIRGVFDRMLASQDAVEHAESVRSTMDLFEVEKPENLTDEQWAAVQQRKQDARDATQAEVDKRSLKNMQWFDRAQSKEIRKAQRAHDAVRSRVRAAVTADTVLEPAYRAMRFLRNGVLTNERGTELPYEGPHKLRTAAVKEIAGPGVEWQRLRITTPEGLDPDVVAQEFGFASGQELINTLDVLRPIDEVIDQRVDREMLLKHGDLQDEAMIRQAIHDALHNDFRAKSVAAQLKAMTGAAQPVRLMIAAAREKARQIIRETSVNDVRSARYESAEVRANREAMAAAAQGDTAAVIDAKWAELLQHELVREARLVERQFERAVNKFQRFKQDDKKIGKRRDIDVVNIGRAILATHGIQGEITNPEKHLNDVRAFRPHVLEDIDDMVRAVTADNTPYQRMTWGDFEAMAQVVDALWEQAQRATQIEVAGKLESKRQAILTLLPKFRPPRGTEGMRSTLPPDKWGQRTFASTWASFRQVESWTMKLDGNTTGNVWKYLFDILRTPYAEYRAESTDRTRPLKEMQTEMEWRKNPKTGEPFSRGIEAPELNGFTFRDKQQLIGALMHSGNASNLEKYLLGYDMVTVLPDGSVNFQPWWDFLDRMVKDGVLQKADFEYVQAVWDTFEDIYARSVEVHRRLYGYRPTKIDAQKFTVEDIGEFRGGYFPAAIDYREAQSRAAELTDPAQQAEYENILATLTDQDVSIDTPHEFRYAMSAGRGFMLERTDVHLPLVMDNKLTAQALDNQLRFIHMQEPGRDAMRLLNDRQLGAAIDRYDPNAREKMFRPFVRDTLRNRIMQTTGSPIVDVWVAEARRNVGMSTMFAKLRVALQQPTGIAASLVALGPGSFTHVRNATTSYFRDRAGAFAEVTAESKDMRERLASHIGQIVDESAVLRGPEWYKSTKQWLEKYGFFLQRMFQTPVDLITYMAAKNKAIGEGRSHTDAVKFAEAIVRRSQGSGLAPDVSAVERGNAITRTLLQFQTFWIALSNLFANRPTKRSALYIGVGVGLVGGAINKALENNWDEDEDGELWDDLGWWTFLETTRTGLTLIPVVSNFSNVLTGQYGGRLSFGAFSTMLEKAGRGVTLPFRLPFREEFEIRGGDVRDFSALIDLLTGIPTSVVSRAVGYELDVQQGRTDEPSGPIDYMRGLIIGR